MAGEREQYFGIGIDTSQIKKQATEATKAFDSIGNSAVAQGQRIDRVVNAAYNLADGNEELQKSIQKVKSVTDAANTAAELANLRSQQAAAATSNLSALKTVYTAVLGRLTTALGGTNAAVQALTGGLSMGLSVAIGAAMLAWEKYNQKQEEAAAALKEKLDLERDAKIKMYETRLELEQTIDSIETFNGTKEQEKAKIQELNKTYGEAFGYYKTLGEWYDVLKQKGEDYTRSVFLQALAQENLKRAIEEQVKAEELGLQDRETFRPWLGRGGKIDKFLTGNTKTAYGSERTTVEYQNQLKPIEENAKRFKDVWKDSITEVNEIFAKSDIGFHSAPDKPKASTKSKDNDPFQKNLEERKKQYEKYNKFILSSDRDVRLNAKTTFATILKDGETYLQFLSKQREKLLETLSTNPSDTTAIKNLQSVRSEIADLENSGLLKEEQARNERLQAIERQKAEMLSDGELKASQARIDAMKSGFDKEMAQIELNFQKEQAENDKRLAQAIKLEADRQELLWNAANPDKVRAGEKFDRSTVTTSSLSIKQLGSHLGSQEQTNQKRLNAEKAVLEKLRADYQTFEEQRTAITEKYSKQRSEIEKAGLVNDERSKLISDEETKALNALDMEIASKNEFFEKWMHSLSGKTLKMLEITLSEAEALLSIAQFDGSREQELATARARVETAKKAVSDAQKKQSEKPDKEAAKAWDVLGDSIYDAATALDTIGDAFGETTKDAIKTVSTILTSTVGVIDNISKLANSSAKAIETTSKTAATAISLVEKASVILTVISLVIQAVTAAINFSKKQAERIRETTVNIRDLNNELDRLARKNNMNSSNGIFGNDEWGQAQKNIKGVQTALDNLDFTLDKVWKAYGTSPKGLETLFGKEALEQFKDWDPREMLVAITKIPNTTQNLLETFPQLFKENGVDYEMLGEFINSELFGKLGAKEQDFLIEVKETWDSYQDYLTATKDYLSSVFGSLGETITDVFVDSFKNGTDAGAAMFDALGDMVETFSKQLIKSIRITPILNNAEKEALAIMERKDLSSAEKNQMISKLVIDAAKEIKGSQELINQDIKNIQDFYAGEGVEVFSADTRTGISKGIAGLTQDQGDEFNGRMTVMTGHTFNINENTKLIVDIGRSQLTELKAINLNTARLEAVERGIKSMGDTLGDISDRGLKVR